MHILVNGENHPLSQPTTVSQYLTQLEIPEESVVVEYNGAILSGENYTSQLLNDQDRIEILRLVGGG